MSCVEKMVENQACVKSVEGIAGYCSEVLFSVSAT
jgi:hypothetical protein